MVQPLNSFDLKSRRERILGWEFQKKEILSLPRDGRKEILSEKGKEFFLPDQQKQNRKGKRDEFFLAAQEEQENAKIDPLFKPDPLSMKQNEEDPLSMKRKEENPLSIKRKEKDSLFFPLQKNDSKKVDPEAISTTSFYQSKNFSAMRLLVALMCGGLSQWILLHPSSSSTTLVKNSSLSNSMKNSSSIGGWLHPFSGLVFFSFLTLSWIGSARCADSKWTSQVDFDFSVYLALSTLVICLFTRMMKWWIPLILSLCILFMFSCYLTLSMSQRIEKDSSSLPRRQEDIQMKLESTSRSSFTTHNPWLLVPSNTIGWISVGSLFICTLLVGAIFLFVISLMR